MKQKIEKYPNGRIFRKYYVNDRGQFNGKFIYYWYNGNIMYKINWANNKRYCLNTDYNLNGKIKQQIYYL